jgi:tyrosyl-tRNA synthetase
VNCYHGEEKAIAARHEWENKFSRGENPSNLETVKVDTTNVVQILVKIGFAKSNNDARRLILQGAVTCDKIKIINIKEELKIPESGIILKVGSRKVVRII